MRLLFTMRSLLTTLAVAGLLLAPIARPLIAAPASDPGTEQVAVDMPADMPCCPDKAPASDCAKNCPLLAICMSSCIQNAPAAGLLIPRLLAGLIVPGDDASPEHPLQAPPGRPPKA